MTLDRAIDILVQHNTRNWPNKDPDLRIAERLGLEALRAYRQARREGQLSPDELLPTETPK